MALGLQYLVTIKAVIIDFLEWISRIHPYSAADLLYRGTVSLSVSTDYMYKLYVQIIILSVQVYIERL